MRDLGLSDEQQDPGERNGTGRVSRKALTTPCVPCIPGRDVFFFFRAWQVVVTKMVTSKEKTNAFAVIQGILAESGPAGFYKGIQVRARAHRDSLASLSKTGRPYHREVSEYHDSTKEIPHEVEKWGITIPCSKVTIFLSI